jgi:protein subunit release factor A
MVFRECDVRYEAFRGSGPGGQHKNKHACCIRAIHEPTGVVAISTSERSQSANKRYALESLKGKLATMADNARKADRKAARDAKPEASFGGAAIRTYRLCGNDVGVVDHRTGVRAGIDALRRGKIDGLIAAYLAAEAA